MTMNFFSAAALAAALFAVPAEGATLVTGNGGTALLGATGVDVDGALFDVSFQDGTCIDLFDGCDGPEDFTFTTQSAARLAAQALLDQVFIDSFDLRPGGTRGCSSAGSCSAFIPYEYRFTPASGFSRPETEEALFAAAQNIDQSMLAPANDGVRTGALEIDEDLTGNDARVFALFTPSEVAVVPLPAAGWLLLGGLAALGAAGRRRG